METKHNASDAAPETAAPPLFASGEAGPAEADDGPEPLRDESRVIRNLRQPGTYAEIGVGGPASFGSRGVQPSPLETAVGQRAYRRMRAWAFGVFGLGVVGVVGFFVFVTLTTSRATLGSVLTEQGASTGGSTLALGLAGGLVAALTLVYLTANLPDLVEKKALSSARRARARFREREGVLYGNATREA